MEAAALHNRTLTGGTLQVMGGPLGDAIVLPFDDVISSIAARRYFAGISSLSLIIPLW
jgi:hypothetical protein